jgi:hypothetical protein
MHVMYVQYCTVQYFTALYLVLYFTVLKLVQYRFFLNFPSLVGKNGCVKEYQVGLIP